VSDARAAILGRLRAGQRTGRLPAAADVHVPASRAPSADETLARFLNELSALGVDTHVETTADCVRARVAALVGSSRVFSWDPEWLPYEAGSVLSSPIRGTDARDLQAAAAIGVTGCDGAIAETGSLVLLPGEGRPRAASLLPPVHLAIVRRGDLRFSLFEYLRERGGAIASASGCVVVTGPSRTADIELTLTLGVHGPGKVIVVVGP
jgi:L-lactate dehydrogenase complex protein LldG